MNPTAKRNETHDQWRERRRAALCMFAGACRAIVLGVDRGYDRPVEAVKELRRNLKELYEHMDWEWEEPR
jgi:hypothetical protein